MNLLFDADPHFQDIPPAQRSSLQKHLTELLESRKEIVFAYLHGSFIAGIPFKDIDLSLYIDINHIPLGQHERYREQLSEELSNRFHHIFDVSLLNDTPDSFSLVIFKEGKLLFSRNETLRTDFIEACSLASVQDEALSMQYLREIVF